MGVHNDFTVNRTVALINLMEVEILQELFWNGLMVAVVAANSVVLRG